MEHTTNYHLPQWDAEDFIKRDDFNDAFAAIDAALAARPYVLGHYTGDGREIADGGQTVALGFRPGLVIIGTGEYWAGNHARHSIAAFDDAAFAYQITFSDGGFTVGAAENDDRFVALNQTGVSYWYAAFR